MAKKPLQTLYESLRANNYDVPDNYGSFERTLTAPGTEGVRNRQTLYKALRANNYDVPDTYESFSRTLFAPVKPTGGTAASGQSMLPADVEERRMRTRNRRGTHPLNKSRARQRLQQQQQAIEAQQKRWEQDNKRFKEDIARREKRLPGGMDRFEERAKEQLATGEASPMPLAPNDEVVRGDIVFNPSTGRMQQTYTTPEGGTFFDRDAAQFDHSLQNMPDDEIGMLEREQELIGMGILRRGRELDEEYENLSFWDRLLAGFATDPEMGPGVHERMYEDDEEMQALMTSWRKNRDALRILYDQRDNNMNSFWHNFRTTVANGYTFTGGRAELHDAQAIMKSAARMDEIQRKMKAGEKLSNVENAALSLANNTAWDNAIQAMYGDDYGAWASAGGAAVQSLEMMPDFIGGMPILKGMGTAATKLLVRNTAKGLGRFMLKGLGMTVGTMAGGAIMANTIQATRTLGKAEGNAVGSWWFGDDGDFMLGHYEGDNFVSGGESLGAALFHAEREAIPEAASEGAGEFLHLGAWGGKVLAKIGLSRIAKPLASLSGKGWYKTYQNMLKAAGWHGVGGEAFEEYIGTLDGLLMGDLEGAKRLGDPRTHIDIWLSCATLGPLLNAPVVLGSSMRAAYSPVAYHKIKAAVTRQDKIASFRLTEDRWAPWRERIDATPNEQMADVLMEVRDSQDLAPQEKKAIFDYAKALQGYRGWNLGEYIFGKDAEEEGEGKSEQEQQQSQQYSNGYETVTPEERRAAKDRLDVARARLESKGYSEQWMQWVESTPIDDVMSDLTERGLAGDTEAVTEYLNAKAAYDGMLARVNDDIDDEVAVANEAIEQRVAPENAGGDGMIHPAVLKGGREVFIISGNVATLADNSIDVENSDSMIIVRDSEGNEDTISPDKIHSLGEVQDPAQQRQEVEQQIVDEQGQAAAAQIEGQLPFNVGDQYTITYQGEPHTYQVVQVEGDNVAVLVDGAQEPVVLTKQQLQQMADEEHAQQIQAQAAATDAVEEEPAEEPSQSDDTVDQAAPVTEEAPVAPEDNPSPSMPMDDQGEPAWNQVAPEIGHQYLYQQSGWPAAMADNFVQARIDEAEKALKKAQDEAQKLIDKPKKTVAENNAAMTQNTAALQAAQAALDYWNAVQAIQAQATAPVVEEATPTVETPAERESTEQAAPVAEVEEPAAPVEETPAAEDEQPEQSLDAAVAEAEQMTDTNPTEGQKEAGNYRKGHVNVHGFEISIEQPKGSVRSGVDADGHEWSQEMHNTYGYIQGTEGVDGDHIDVFLSDHLDDWNGLVFVVDQVNKDGSFDEHKVMIGFNSTKEAQEAYLSNYEEGWTGLGNITVINEFDFKDWINSSHRKTKPFAEYNIAREKAILEEEESEAPVAENEMQPVEEPTTDNGGAAVELSPEMEIVQEAKSLYPGEDRIVILRFGDHYEVYNQDAERLHEVMGDKFPITEVDGEGGINKVVEIKPDQIGKVLPAMVNAGAHTPIVRQAPAAETAQSAATEDQAEAPAEEAPQSDAIPEQPAGEAEPEKTDIELLQEEFEDELSRKDIKVEVLPETFEESSAEMTVNVTVDEQATNIWFAVGEGNTVDEHWKRIYVPFYEMSWQEVDDLAEEYNQAMGKIVCDANDEAKRINFKDIEEAIAFEKWMQERARLKMLEARFGYDLNTAHGNVSIIPNSVEEEDGVVRGKLRIDGKDSNIWVSVDRQSGNLNVYAEFEPGKDVQEGLADEFNKYFSDEEKIAHVTVNGDIRFGNDDIDVYAAVSFFKWLDEMEEQAKSQQGLVADIQYSIESQGEVPKGEKPKAFKMGEVTSNDGNRNGYALGVYHDPSGTAVATDGYIMIVDSREYDEQHKGKVIAQSNIKKGSEIKEPIKKGEEVPVERYPNWKSVFPKKKDTDSVKVNFNALCGWLAGVEKRMKEQWQQWKQEHPGEKMSFDNWRSRSAIQILMPDGKVQQFKFDNLYTFARAAASQGAKTLRYYPNQDNRAFSFDSKFGSGLVMPYNTEHYSYIDNPYRYENGLGVNLDSSMFTYDMSNGLTMPGKTAGNRVELNYESGKDAESRAYIEEVMEREGWDEEAKSEFRKILDDAADLVSRMAQGFTRLREWNNKKLTDEQGNYNPLWRVFDKDDGWIPTRSSFKKNGEYPYNIDLGALCTKREAFDAVVRYIKEQGWGQNLGPTQIEALKSLLREHGFLTACDICFNETRRARALDYGNAVAYYWNAVRQAVGIDDDLPIGTPRELTDEQMKRLTELSKSGKAFSKYVPKELRRTYETYVNTKGQTKRREVDKGLTPTMTRKVAKLFLQDPSLMGKFEGTMVLSTDSVDALVRQFPHTDIARFLAGAWGSNTPKPNEGFNIYDPLSWKQTYDKKRQRPAMEWFFNLGGMRAQSFSDYSPIFFYDYVQMFTDLAIRRLPIHIYTKVPALIKLFGGTGAKFNMSLVPEVVQGVDPEHLGLKPDGNGGWVYAWHEDSFPVDEAFALRQDPRFKGNVGTIAVGISDAHIRMLLDDPTIDMVIPYHKSGMPPSIQVKTGLDKATDYTDDQHSKKRGKALKNDFSFNEALRRLGDPRKAAAEYLAWCKEHNYTPKYPQFADHPNYYKVLEDFRCIDNEGNYSPQQPVQVSFFDDVEQRLSESLEDKTMQEGLDSAIRGNDAITEGIKKIMSKPRLDGKIRDMLMARLKQVLGKDNVASLKQEDFFEELQKVYTDQMGAERAQQQVEVLRTSGGIVYGFAVGDRIVLNENYFNAETPMHEFTHVWVKVARLANPQMWAEGKELLKQTKEWQEVMNDEFYRDIQGDEDAVASEVLARIVGQDAARQINEMFAPEDKPQERPGIYNKIKQWVNQFLDGVRSLFSDNAKGLTYDELVRMPMKALFDDAEAARFMEALQQVNEEDVDLQIIGETGADRLDRSDSVNRIYNRDIAEEMERAGKDAKTIKLATGWERGSDKKWRYEIEDGDFVGGGINVAEAEEGGLRLSDIWDSPELFDAYPDLYNVPVSIVNNPLGATAGVIVERAKDTPGFSVSRDFIKDYDSYLEKQKKKLAEYKERLERISEEDEEARVGLQDVIDNVERSIREAPDRLARSKELVANPNKITSRWLYINKAHLSKDGIISADAVFEGTSAREVIAHEIQHLIQEQEGFASGSSPADVKRAQENINGVYKTVDDLAKKLGYNDWMKTLTPEKISNAPELRQKGRWFNMMYLFANDMKSASVREKFIAALDEANDVIAENESITGKLSNPHDAYHRSAGEVEARNVQKRLNMPENERRATLFDETEDVPRDQQIVRSYAGGTSEYRASLGAPYQGSKGQIATRIVDALPSGKRFVDLFSGGGAVTHAAMLSGKYEGYRMNDLNPAGQELFLAGMRGDYRDYQPRELTAEEFKAIKGTPEGLLLSYSGYGRNVDSDKESVARRLRRVQRLEELKPYADQVEPSNTDYREVQLQPGDVVYADIPYEGTNKTGYREGAKFDKQAFSDWALGQDVPIYVSEQSMPEGWVEVQSWDMKAMRGKTRGEKLFVQAKFAGDGGRGNVRANSAQYNDNAGLDRDEERTLMGMHNITAEKLRSALKLGGLANPSMAVINTEVGGFTNFGEISLIPSADMIASRSGNNAGTWGADAYSPRFPETYRRLGKGGDKKLSQWVKTLAQQGMRQEMVYNTEEQFNDYYNGFNIRDNALVYPFLFEKGLADQVEVYDHNQVSQRFREIVDRFGGDINRLMDAYRTSARIREEISDALITDAVFDSVRKQQGESFSDLRKRRLEFRKEYTEAVVGDDGRVTDDVAYSVLSEQCKAYNEGSKFNPNETRGKAVDYLLDNGMYDEYQRYFEQKMQELGAETQVYAGSDNMGRSKFKPANLEEISRKMKSKGRAGGEGGIFSDGPGAVRAKLLTPMKTLDQIRQGKGRIVNHEQFEKAREQYQEELREYADNYADGSMSTLADILTSGNMQATAKQYNIDLDADAVADLNGFKERVRALPTEYFETKFERPVMLDEFKKAVVPDNLSADLRKALENAGLEIVQYPVGDTAARERVTLDAVKNDDDIRFRDDDEVAERDREYQEAVERGDMKRAQEMLMEEADRKLNEALQLPDDSGEMGFKYHRGPAPKKIRTMYAVLNVSPDGMRAAYAGNKTTTPIGVWLDAVPLKSYASDKNKNDDGQPSRYVPGDTGHNWKLIFSEETYAQMMKDNPEITKSTKWLYERGGKHGTDVPNFSQMNVKDPANVGTPKEGALTSLPHNKLVFEIECGMDEDGDLTEYVKENGRFVKGKSQGLSWVGTNKFYFFKTNPNASGNWGIAGTFRIKRLVPYEEIVSETAKANERIKAENERIAKENEGKPKSKQKKLIKEIPLQRWVGEYKPEDSGISVADVDAMYQQGKKMKLMEPTYDDNGNLIPLSQRFDLGVDDMRFREILEDGGTLRVYKKENGGLQNVDEVVVREDNGQWVFNHTIPGRFASRDAALDALADYAFREGMNVKGEPGSNTYVIRRRLPKGQKWRVEGVPGEFDTQFGAVDNARNFLQGHVFEVAEDGNSIEVLGAGSNLDNMLNGRGEAATQETATGTTPQTAKERKAEERARKWRERTVANGRRRIEELGQRLGVKVTIVDDMSEQEREGMSKKKRRAKGWYDVRTGEVFINLGNHRTVSDIEATFLHEVVAHKGLRRLFGDEFNTFLHNVYYNVDASIREEINRLMAKNNWDYREATEEYLAKLAQQMNFERPDRYLKAWETVARLFRTLLQKMGLGNGMNLKDSDLQGILFESYHNMEKEGVAGLAESVEFRDAMEREANLPRQSRDTENLAATAAESMFRDDEDELEDFEDSEDFYEEELEEEAENPDDLGEEVDDSEAGPSTFQEMMLGKMLQAANSAGAAQSARVAAMRTLGSMLADLRRRLSQTSNRSAYLRDWASEESEDILDKTTKAQRNYDRDTVNTIVRLAREVMASGYFNDLTRGEVKRLLAAAKNANGSANVTEQANKVVDTLLRHHLRECENLLKKQLKVKGSKENASGVEVQAGLDIEGQRMTTAMKQGMRLDEQGLSDRVAECLSRMGSSDPVVSSVAAQEYTGLMLAQQYHDTIKASRQEEQQMREEMRQAKAEFAAHRDNLSPEELKRQRQDLKDYIAATEDAIRQNRMERADAYNQLSEMLGGGIASSMERAKQWREQQKERVRDIQHNANSDLEGVPADEHMKPTWKHRMANWSVVRFFMKPLATFDYMLRMMGQKSPNGEGYLWNRFMGGWVEANNNEWRNVKAAHQVLDEKVKEVFNADRPGLPKFKVKRWSDLFFIERKMKGMDVDFWDGDQIKTHTLTPGNLLYIYMVNKMSDGKMKLRKMGISEEDVEAIKNHLDPRLIELADWLQDEFLVQKRTEYNAVHERMFGAPMAAIENYFPLKINSRSRSQEEDVNNQEANPDDNRGSTITGAIIKRVRNNKALDVTGADAFDVILEHIQNMEHWAAFAEFNRDLNTLLSYKRFRNRMLNMASARFGSGKKLWTNFKRVCAIASGVYRPKVDYDSVDTNLVNVAKGVTRAKISFRFYTALKQLLSYPAYLSTANPIELAKSSNPVGAVFAWNWAIDNLPGFAERWQSRQAGDTRLKESDADWGLWKSKIIDTASRWGMSPNAFIDALTVAMGAKAIYETKFKQYKKLGYPEEQAKRRAQRDASVAYNETQQSSANAYTSAMQLDRTAASVALTVFRNASMGYQRRLFQSFANLKHMATKGYKAQSLEYLAKQMERDGLDHATAEAAAKKVYNRTLFQNIADVAIFGWVMQAAWNLGAYLPYLFMGDDDDDKKDMLTDAALHAIAGGIEGLTGGSVISDTYNSIRSGDAKATYSNELLPLLSDIESLKRTFKKDVIEGANDLVNLIVQAGVGVNPQTITDWVVAGLDMANGDPELANEFGLLVMRVMSAPQGQLDQLYIDELGMTAGDARKLNAEEFANRYARYKMGRESTFTGWAYSEQGHNDAVDRYVKNFGKKVQERLVGKDIATLDDAYERGDDYMKDIVGKAIKKRLEAADDSELPGIYKYTTNEVTKKTAGGEMAKRISKNEELDSYFDKQRDPVLRKAAASEIAKRLSTQDYAGKTPQAKWTQETKDAHERYQELRTAADIKEDCQVTLLKVSDEDKAELREIKKYLGQGGDDAAIMQEYREARKEILKNYQ